MAIDYWRSYLQLAEFAIKTDQKSLIHLDDQRLNSYWQHKALTKLLGLQYKICYKKESTNGAADPYLEWYTQSQLKFLQYPWLSLCGSKTCRMRMKAMRKPKHF